MSDCRMMKKTKQEIQNVLTQYFKCNDNDTICPSTLCEGAKVVKRGKISAISSLWDAAQANVTPYLPLCLRSVLHR